jgi:ATP-binding cassette subfamily F protein 3
VFNATHITKYYGAQTVLSDVSFSIGAGEHVGLVGRNGSGKSTLLRILAGVEGTDKGGIQSTRRNLSVGYVPQFGEFASDSTMLEAAMEGLPPTVPLWQARKALFGLGFREEQLDQTTSTLSGGQKTRLLLARALVGEHDLLLMDEPTSHLDIEMIRWLETFLAGYSGAYLIASHDRRFLDRTVRRIIEVENQGIHEYSCGYSAYAEAKRAALERQKEDYILQQKQIRSLKEFVSRQMGWAAATQGGLKRGRDQRGRISEKMAKRAHAAERRIEQMAVVAKPRDEHHLSARLQPSGRGGHIVFEAKDLAKSFSDKPLFTDVNLTVTYGERIGLIGANGAGKTTLLRVLLGQETSTQGMVRTGASLEPLFLAQEHEQLDAMGTVLDAVQQAGGLTHTEARTLLACFLFRQDEVFKRVGDLSGGERARLAAATAVVTGSNLLVLDEPTNHLDIDTRERLEDALEAYSGTLIVVSHDRSLLDKLANRLWIIEEGKITDFAGRYCDWEETGALV